MRDVAIIGAGMIPFGRRDEDTLMEMLAYASLKALDDAGLGDKSVDAVYVANMGGGMLQHQIGHCQFAGGPPQPAARGGRDDRKRPRFGSFGRQERAAGGCFRLLRLRSGGRRREDARGHRLARHRFCRHHDPSAGGISLRHHPARHGRHVHPAVYGKVRRDPRAPAGRLPEEPGDGHAESLRPCRDGTRPQRHLRQPACHRQQSRVRRPAASVRPLPGQRWRGGGGPVPAGDGQEARQAAGASSPVLARPRIPTPCRSATTRPT